MRRRYRDAVMESSIQDCLLCGRGVNRVLYVHHFGDEIEPRQIARKGTKVVANRNDYGEAEEMGSGHR
jgi:hypothetical protein